MPSQDPHPSTRRGEHAGDPLIAWRLDAPSPDPTLPLVLGLHGRGQSEDLFAQLLHGFGDRPFRLLLPRGPLPVADAQAGASWYDYDGDQEHFRAALNACEARLLALLRAVEREQGLQPRQRWLLGFSQGGYCGSWLALRNPDCFDGMAIVGARVKTEFLADAMRRAAARGFQALLCHGRRDRAVPFEAAERSRDGLAAAGVAVELREFEAGHSLGRDMLTAIADSWEGRSAES